MMKPWRVRYGPRVFKTRWQQRAFWPNWIGSGVLAAAG